MKPEYMLDSSAWVEYLSGSPRGGMIREIVEQKAVSCSIIALAELADKFRRDQQPFESHLAFIKTKSLIVPIDESIALSAAELKWKFRPKKPRFSLADGIHLATAMHHSCTLVTFDTDFEGTDNVLIPQ